MNGSGHVKTGVGRDRSTRAEAAWDGLVALEQRVLLSGDDYPDWAQFPDAHELDLALLGNGFTVFADLSGEIETATDTDLFSFTATADARVGAAVAVQTELYGLAPYLRVLDEYGDIVGEGDNIRGAANWSFDDGSYELHEGHDYYFVVSAGTPSNLAPELTGTYRFFMAYDELQDAGGGGGDTGGGDTGGGGGDTGDGGDDGGDDGAMDDDHTDEGYFDLASSIDLDDHLGDGSIRGAIEWKGDTDLFRIDTLAPGTVNLQIQTPIGSTMDGHIAVFGPDHNPISYNEHDTAGSAVSATFVASAAQTYYILVTPLGALTGDYSLRVDSQPLEHVLYYPEGFSSGRIEEFVPLVNPNETPVDYTVIARYEVGERDQVLATGTLAPHSRGGVTITSARQPGSNLTRLGEPYALEVRSNGQIGATFSHYDFGVTTGENFTDTLSRQWTFAQVHKIPDTHRDFLLYYNPQQEQVNLSITLYYQDGTTALLSRSIDALRRGGINFNEDPEITAEGVFGVRVEADQPIVAAVSSYDFAHDRGYGYLGDHRGGNERGAIAGLTVGEDSAIAILNTGGEDATVTLTATAITGAAWQQTITVTAQPHQQSSYTLTQLGLDGADAIGLTYAADTDVTVMGLEFQFGDGDATPAATEASTVSLIGDAFVYPGSAGTTYVEELTLYNPNPTPIDVVIRYYHPSGARPWRMVSIAADSYQRIDVHDDTSDWAWDEPAFSIRVSSVDGPFVTSFVHYDLFLDGGWATLGAPLGLTNLLERL
jgi:hypothetical protein